MIKAVIIEDEEKSVKVIRKLTEKFFADTLEIVGQADGVDSGIALIEQTQPQLAFMDIELIDGSSFSIIKHFPNLSFRIIFTTAFDNYAIKAFRFSAIDYLLKPIDDDEFCTAVEKFLNTQSDKSQEQLELASQLYQHPEDINRSKIAIKSNHSIIFEPLTDLVAFLAVKNYTEIFSIHNKKYTTSKNLGFYEELLLSVQNFFRIHHSTIINLDYIQSLNYPKNSHSATVKMKDGSEYTVSARRLASLKERLYI